MDVRQRVLALNEERLRTWNAAKNLLDDVAATGRDLNAEERQTYQRAIAAIGDIDAEVSQLVAQDQREREAGQLREASGLAFGSSGGYASREARAADSLRAWMLGADNPHQPKVLEVDIRGALRERDLIRQGASPAEVRALAWDASSGSLVVPTSMARSIVEVLQENIAAMRMGCTQLNTQAGENLVLPTLATHSIGTQVSGQGVAIGGTDPVFGNVALNVYKYGQLVKVAAELVTDAAFDIGAWLGRDIGYALARVIDADLIVGTGTAEPTGYTTLAGAGTNAPITTGGSLIAPSIEKWIDTLYSVSDNARRNAVWLMRDSVAGTVAKLRDGAGGTVGAFLWQPSPTRGLRDGAPDTFMGFPVFTDVNCQAAGSDARLATFGDPASYVIRTVGNVRIERSDDVYFATDELAYRGKWRVGGNHAQKSHLNQLIQRV